MDDTTNRDDSFIAFDGEMDHDKESTNSTSSKVWKFLVKFFLAVIAIGLVVMLVFQIIIISSRTECKVQAINP